MIPGIHKMFISLVPILVQCYKKIKYLMQFFFQIL